MATYPISNGQGFAVDSRSGEHTVLAPSNPGANHQFGVADYAKNFGTTPVHVDFNGERFEGYVQGYTLNSNGESAIFNYLDSVVGWIVVG